MYVTVIDFVAVFVATCGARAWFAWIALIGVLGLVASQAWPWLIDLPAPALVLMGAAVWALPLLGWYLLSEWVFNVQVNRELLREPKRLVNGGASR